MGDVCDECGWGEGRHARNCPMPTLPSVTELLGPKPDPGYLRAVEKQKYDPRDHPPIFCSSASIDLGMAAMEDERLKQPPIGSCDWGGCDEPGETWRFSPVHAEWLPVCIDHDGPGPKRPADGWTPTGHEPATLHHTDDRGRA